MPRPSLDGRKRPRKGILTLASTSASADGPEAETMKVILWSDQKITPADKKRRLRKIGEYDLSDAEDRGRMIDAAMNLAVERQRRIIERRPADK